MAEQIQTRFLSSVIWSVMSRWSSKLLGMINTVVLARILAPEDFGIVAMATIVITMLDSMTQVGVHLYTIRHKDDDPRVFNTGWTVNLIQSLLIALILFLTAPYIALYFREPAVEAIVYCLAIIKVINGCENFAIYIAQKQLDFNFDFKITLYTRLSYTVATIGFALWLESYWAIILGQGFSVIVGCFLSYYMHSFRPKFQLYQWRKMLKFSQSMIPLSTGRFINNQADVTIIGRVASAGYLGQYHIAANLAFLFTKELMMPFIRGLVPNLSKLKGTDDFNDVLSIVIASACYIFLPLGLGLAAVSDEFVLVLLGEKWIDTAPILMWLSLYAMLSGLMMFISEQFLIILEHEQLSNRLMWVRNFILVSSIVIALQFYGYQQIPMFMVIASAISLPLVLLVVAQKLSLEKRYLLKQAWPSLIAATLMWLVLDNMPTLDVNVFLVLAIKIALGVMVYSATIGILYVLRGRPSETPERLLLNKVVKR